MDAAGIKEKMKAFIKETFMTGGGHEEFEDDESFLENGIIDSTGVLELVTFVEETFDIDVEDEEMVPDNLDSFDNLTVFVDKKLKAE
ncbi:MAG: acyl carrier protein [bacterium]|nr:acyl carrier protein [bacterium]